MITGDFHYSSSAITRLVQYMLMYTHVTVQLEYIPIVSIYGVLHTSSHPLSTTVSIIIARSFQQLHCSSKQNCSTLVLISAISVPTPLYFIKVVRFCDDAQSMTRTSTHTEKTSLVPSCYNASIVTHKPACFKQPTIDGLLIIVSKRYFITGASAGRRHSGVACIPK